MVKVKAEFNNQAKDHRLRALFPSGLVTDHHYADSIFEVAKRPNIPAKEWVNPSNAQHQQAFVHVTDDSAGLMIANKGLNEYEILQETAGSTIAVTLLRASSELGDWVYSRHRRLNVWDRSRWSMLLFRLQAMQRDQVLVRVPIRIRSRGPRCSSGHSLLRMKRSEA